MLCVVLSVSVLLHFRKRSLLGLPKNSQKCVNPPQTLNVYLYLQTLYRNTILYLMIGVILTHYFPVILILRIYNIKTERSPEKKSSLTFSLIDWFINLTMIMFIFLKFDQSSSYIKIKTKQSINHFKLQQKSHAFSKPSLPF